MSKQFVWALVATLGLAGCGGGGGGGSDDSDDLPNLSNVSASNLVGTWIQTNVNFADPMDTGSYEWVKTKRETIVVTRSGSGLIFTNCVTGNAAAANLADGVVTFPAFPAWELDVVNGSTMTMTLVQPESETEVELRKVTSSTRTTAVGIGVDVSVDLGSGPNPISQLNQVCVETIVDKYSVDSVEVRAVGRVSASGVPVDGEVSMKFESVEYFTDRYLDTYFYPSIDGSDASGTYDVNFVGSGSLSDPNGNMEISKNVGTGAEEMVFELTMYSEELEAHIFIDGEFSLDPEWLALPDGE